MNKNTLTPKTPVSEIKRKSIELASAAFELKPNTLKSLAKEYF